MSGDIGLHEQPNIFYHREMTEAKKILLKHKGIELAYLEICLLYTSDAADE